MTNEKKMNEHWNFLRNLMETIVFESENIIMTAEQIDKFSRELDNFEFGFKLAWPHAWKHSKEDTT